MIRSHRLTEHALAHCLSCIFIRSPDPVRSDDALGSGHVQHPVSLKALRNRSGQQLSLHVRRLVFGDDAAQPRELLSLRTLAHNEAIDLMGYARLHLPDPGQPLEPV